MRVLTGLAAAWLLFAPAAGRAATITYTSQFFPVDNAQGPQFSPTDWDGTSQSLTLPQFNPALGTLTSIDLSLLGNIQSSGALNNTGANTAEIAGGNAAMAISILAPDTPTPWDGAAGTLITVRPALFSIGAATLAAGGSIPFGPVASTDSGAASITDFTPYVGADNVLFPLGATADSTFETNGGNLELSQSTGARAQAAITYTFDAAAPSSPVDVPEPAASAVLGAGLLCLGLLRRRG